MVEHIPGAVVSRSYVWLTALPDDEKLADGLHMSDVDSRLGMRGQAMGDKSKQRKVE